MEKIEIISLAVGTAATILGGVWVMLNNAFSKGAEAANINNRIDSVEKEVRCYTEDTDIIKQWIMKFDASMVDKLARKHSPRQLTELGKKVLEMSGANEILPKICDELIKEMEQRRINTAFDAETEAYFAMLRNDKNEAFNGLKNFIYNAPDSIEVEVDGEKTAVKLDYTSIVRILSLNLRDEYIRRHPNILVTK